MTGSQSNSVKNGFMDEVKSYIPLLKDGIHNLRKQPQDPDVIQEIYRLVHIIRGAASLIGIQGLGHTASQMEMTLEEVMEKKLDISTALLDAMTLTVNSFEAYTKGNVSDEEGLSTEIQLAFSQFRDPMSSIDEQGPYVEDTSGFDLNDLDPLSASPSFDSGDPDVEIFLAGNAPIPDIDPFMADDEPGDQNSDSISEPGKISSEIVDIFYEEAETHFETINKNLEQLEKRITRKISIQNEERQMIREIGRSVHTIKGAAGLVGMTALSQWAHTVEDLLDWLFDQAAEIDPEIVLTLLKSADILELFVSDPDKVRPDNMDALEKEFSRITCSLESDSVSPEVRDEDVTEYQPSGPSSRSPEEVSEEKDESDGPSPSRAPGTFRVNMEKLDALVNLASEQIISLSAFDQDLGAFQQTMDELEIVKSRLRRVSRDLEVGYEVKAIQKMGSDVSMEFDALELDRYSKFNLIIRALAESVVDVGEITNRFQNFHSNFDSYITRQRVILGELQTKLMSTRMAPMSVITARMRRTVRNVSAKLEKKINLTIEGEEIELDRVIWEKLADPLLHILRNAADHGIEMPKERRLAGKAETGMVRISASRQGNLVLISIQDDGAGLNFSGIREKAESLFGQERAGAMGEDELANLVFSPGFSTRKTVTQISGRGVGMDVVRNNIEELKGSVRISSLGKGQGTLLTVRIPLTLALIQAVICKVGERSYAVPLNEISDILRVPQESIIHDPVESIVTGEEVFPLYRLSQMLGISDSSVDEKNPIVLKVGAGDHMAMIGVEALIGQREIVIKSLGSHLQFVRGISGVTVMGDGSIVPILNIGDFLTEDEHQPLPHREKTIRKESLEILIVDDSVSVRNVIARLMESQGWETTPARDGLEALEKLSGMTPDLIVLDIEMPRMNGYEFLAARRSNPEYMDIPVVILTSRSSDKYREKAKKLDADAYVIKPFNDKNFVATVRRLAARERGSWQ